MTLGMNDIQHNHTHLTSIEFCNAECRYAVCRDYFNVMISVVMLRSIVILNVVMLRSVVILNVVMLSVVAIW